MEGLGDFTKQDRQLGCRAWGGSKEELQVFGYQGVWWEFPVLRGAVNKDTFVLSGLWDPVFWTQGVL